MTDPVTHCPNCGERVTVIPSDTEDMHERVTLAAPRITYRCDACGWQRQDPVSTLDQGPGMPSPL